jgi:ribosomal protein L19E
MVLRVFVDRKIGMIPDSKQPLRQGIRKEFIKENPETETERHPWKEAQRERRNKLSRQVGSRRGADGTQVPRVNRTAGRKKELSVLQVVKFKV